MDWSRGFLAAATALLLLLLAPNAGASCTILAVPDADGSIRFVGKSYDWATQAAILNANVAGFEKRAFLFPSSQADVPTEPVIWKSLYPSLTINQYGRDFPLAGMNSHGLVVETAEMDPGSNYLDGANYTPPGATEVITSNQWVQYILDRYDSVSAFLADQPSFAIMYSKVPVHFMICDPIECLVVEIRNNDLRITQGLDLGIQPPDGAFIPVPVLTNDYYHCSVNGRDSSHSWALRDYQGFGGTRMPIPSFPNFCDGTNQKPGECDTACRSAGAWINSNSVQRFVRATAESRSLSMNPDADASDLFNSLNKVYSKSRETGGTKFQIVYDPINLEMQWRTIADGTDEMSEDPHGFTGTPRSVSFDDFFSRGLLEPCTGSNDVQVASIDQATSCPPPGSTCKGGEPYVCNPTPDLAKRVGQSWPWTQYKEVWNRQLVSFAATHSSVGTGDFSKMVKDRLNGIDDAGACQIMFNIWGGYPRGYTACGGSVQPEQVVNL
ncbi:MAG: hypothetical protein R3338_00750, partial [Thermoanaerobaculia bacterium]|nr:hypothetical protein [Thermoanaerobaculia bacterium]